MEILTNFDIYTNAYEKCNLNEEAMPTVRGMVVENIDTYNKIQKLLNTNKLESCHKFLYNLDTEDLTEEEIKKVDNLYNLGIKHGLILGDLETSDSDIKTVESDNEIENLEQNKNEKSEQSDEKIKTNECENKFSQNCIADCSNSFTVMYSATKDGEIKCGEAYSNAVNVRSAKADVLSKLANCGYNNISILAIEVGDPDSVGCCNKPVFKKIPTDSFQSSQETIDKQLYNDLNNIQFENEKESSSQKEEIKSDDSEIKETENDKESMSDKEENSTKQDSDKKSNIDEEEDSDDENLEEEDSDDENSEEEDSDNENLDDENLDDENSDDENSEEEDSEEEDSEENTKLTAAEKTAFKNEYKTVFKNQLKKMKIKTSLNSVDFETKIKFFTNLSKEWGSKPDPSKFLKSDEQVSLEKMKLTK